MRSQRKTFICSRLTTLEDIAKSSGVESFHIHCQFPYSEYLRCRSSLDKELIKLGVRSLFFNGIGFINITNNKRVNHG